MLILKGEFLCKFFVEVFVILRFWFLKIYEYSNIEK